MDLKADIFTDPYCDPDHPVVIHFEDISAAAYKIRAGIKKTPCTDVGFFGHGYIFQKGFYAAHSFKERGARNTLLMLSKEQRLRGVIAASAGNHALALSYHGSQLGIPVTVVMPLVAPMMKIELCKKYGANVVIHGADLAEAKHHAMKLAYDNSYLYINGYDHPHILAGQGTLGLEIVEQVPDLDAVIVPIGGAGLIAGVALAVKSIYPRVQVIGAEPERCPSYAAAVAAGRPVYTKSEGTLADGLAVPVIGVNSFATALPLVDKVVPVGEEYIALAILRLVEQEKAVVEGAGAIGLGAILSGALPELKGKKVAVVLCGGNIDTSVLGRCLERGLAADGRLCRFVVRVSDRPGGISELTRLIASIGVGIKDIFHERAWLKSDIFSVQVKVIVETRDRDHCTELEQLLREHYTYVDFGQNIV